MQSWDTSWNNVLNDWAIKGRSLASIRSEEKKKKTSIVTHDNECTQVAPLPSKRRRKKKKEWSAWNSTGVGSGGTSNAACPRLLNPAAAYHPTSSCPWSCISTQQCQTPCSMLCYTTQFLANNNATPHAACHVTPHSSLPTTMSILFSRSFLRFQLNWTGLEVEQTSLRPSENPCKYTWAAPHTSGGVGGHPKASDSQPHSVHTAGGRRRKNVNSCLTGEFWGPLLNRKQ